MNPLMLLAALAGIGGTIALAMAGVFQVRNTEGTLDITIDKKKLKREARKAAERTKDAGRKAVHAARDTLAKARERFEVGRTVIHPRTRATSPKEKGRHAASANHHGRES